MLPHGPLMIQTMIKEFYPRKAIMLAQYYSVPMTLWPCLSGQMYVWIKFRMRTPYTRRAVVGEFLQRDRAMTERRIDVSEERRRREQFSSTAGAIERRRRQHRAPKA